MVFANGLERSALSSAALELLPEGEINVVRMRDGSLHQGVIARSNDEEVIIRVQQPGNITVGRRLARADIASIESADVAPLLAERLLEFELDPDRNLELGTYDRKINLMDEFLEKARGAEAHTEVQERRDAFAEERERVRSGMEKVDGTWLPPVAASIKNFQLVSDAIRRLERHPDFRQSETAQRRRDSLVERRRDIARRTPQMMAERLPNLLSSRNFAEAVYETTSLLRFWIEQVVESEGPAREVLGQMDFSFILNMFEQIMSHYSDAGRGRMGPPAGAPSPREMVYVPGGYFLMGEKSSDPDKDTFPMRMVYVSPFLIDRYEVTNEDYRRFVEYVQSTGASWFAHPDAPPLKQHAARGWQHPELSGDRQPVVGVDWYDAFAYARWSLGREAYERGVMTRLPTEAEWEKAARSTDGRRFAWGDASPSGAAVNWPDFRRRVGQEMDRQNPPPEPKQSMMSCIMRKEVPPPPPTVIPEMTWEVDQLLPEKAREAQQKGVLSPPWQHRDVSDYGVYHMAGNAAEWVQDYYERDYYRNAPIVSPRGPQRGVRRVVRGGSYLDGAEFLNTWSRRSRTPMDASGKPFIGFRRARSLDIVKDDVLEDDDSFDAFLDALPEAETSGR